MEYRLYIMTANGFKYQGTGTLDQIMYALEIHIMENPSKQIIVVQHDIERDMDDTFYVHTGRVEDFLEWKECIYKCVDNEKNKKL